MNNLQVEEVFQGIAGLLEIKDAQRFTVVAYQRVARTIDKLPIELEQVLHDGQDLKAIPGIGNAISQKLSELVSTGKLDFFEQLRSEFPDGILEVRRAPDFSVAMAIDSDAHTVERLDNQRYGVAIARRAWREAQRIVNTLPTDAFIDFLIVGKSRRREALQTYE